MLVSSADDITVVRRGQVPEVLLVHGAVSHATGTCGRPPSVFLAGPETPGYAPTGEHGLITESSHPQTTRELPTEHPAGHGPVDPVRLTPDSVDEFLLWAAGTGVHEADLVRKQIAAAAGGTLAVLVASLHDLPVHDCGRHLILLAVLGEMRSPEALDPLETFVWTQGQITTGHQPHEETPAHGAPGLIPCDLDFDTSTMLRARAVEMLAYLATGEAVDATLRIVRDHPETGVRIAAIDAHLFNQGDTDAVIDALRPHVRESDRKWVGVPRFTRDIDRGDFDRALSATHAHLDEHAEVPHVVEPPDSMPPPKRPERAPSPGREPTSE